MTTSHSITQLYDLYECCNIKLITIFFIFTVLLFLYLLRKFIQGPSYNKTNRIDDKVAIVTGCNTGIGKETALELARRGAKVYMACRNAAACEKARLEIIQLTGNANVYNCNLNLGSLQSIRTFVDKFLAEEQRLDILVNNAGVLKTTEACTVDGFEQRIGVNHLGHFLLTNLLLKCLQQSAPSRIVVVSSIVYLMGSINKHNLNSTENFQNHTTAYAQSKLANILFSRKLAELLQDTQVTVNCCHPGVVHTNMVRIRDWWTCIDLVLSYFLKSPKAGAQTSLRLALDPSLAQSTGGFYMDCIKFPLLPHARNTETANWLWNESEKLVRFPRSQSINGGCQ